MFCLREVDDMSCKVTYAGIPVELKKVNKAHDTRTKIKNPSLDRAKNMRKQLKDSQ